MVFHLIHIHNFYGQTVNGGKNVISGVDNSSSVDIDNRKKYLSS